MTRDDIAQCLALVAAAYRIEITDAEVEAWHFVIGDFDAFAVFGAVRDLCRRDSPFAPTPGEVVGAIRRRCGETPPTPAAALGYFESGAWEAHPMVAAVARKVHWDRRYAADLARSQFRSLYEAALDAAEREAAIDTSAAIERGEP